MFTLQMGKSRPIKNVLSIRMATQPPKSWSGLSLLDPFQVPNWA
jgi:hypothetical protein